MSQVELLNTDDIRFVRYYIRRLHQYFDYGWDINQINGYSKSSLLACLHDLISKYKNHPKFASLISTLNKNSRNQLIDKSLFNWINTERATSLIWCLLGDHGLNTNNAEWEKRYIHLCFNTTANILDYIVWTFDDADSEKVSQRIKNSKLITYKQKYAYTTDTNKINWIDSNNSEQHRWIYNYLSNKSDFDFSAITAPVNEKQYYRTVVLQLDMICLFYAHQPENWAVFVHKLKKAWTTQSDRLKKRKQEIQLDRESIKMLRSIVGKGASDAMLKKRLKEIIRVEYSALEGNG